jgi:hypothetical protein
VARMGEERKVYRVLAGKPEGKRSLEKPRRRWENGIRMDLKEIGWGSVEWFQLAHDRDQWRAFVNTVMNLRLLAPRSQLASYKSLRTSALVTWSMCVCMWDVCVYVCGMLRVVAAVRSVRSRVMCTVQYEEVFYIVTLQIYSKH